MRQQLDRTRLFISTWYTGSGSLKSVFTRKPNRPFTKIKQIYGEELERLNAQHKHIPLEIHELSEEQKASIRLVARAELTKWYRTKITILLVSIVISALLIYSLYHFILLKLI